MKKRGFGNFLDKIHEIELSKFKERTGTVVIYCDASMCQEKKFSAVAVTITYKHKRIKTFSKIHETQRFGELYAIFEAIKEAAKYKNNPVIIYNDYVTAIRSIKKRIFYGEYPEAEEYPEHRKEVTDKIIKLLKENKNIWIRERKRNHGKGMKIVDELSRVKMRQERERRKEERRAA